MNYDAKNPFNYRYKDLPFLYIHSVVRVKHFNGSPEQHFNITEP